MNNTTNDDQEPEATCDGNSICSFLQANNHVRPQAKHVEWNVCPQPQDPLVWKVNAAKILFKGVNVVEYCKCKGFSECSTQWDPYDGKSITQAQSDQYKVGLHTHRMTFS